MTTSTFSPLAGRAASTASHHTLGSFLFGWFKATPLYVVYQIVRG